MAAKRVLVCITKRSILSVQYSPPTPHSLVGHLNARAIAVRESACPAEVSVCVLRQERAIQFYPRRTSAWPCCRISPATLDCRTIGPTHIGARIVLRTRRESQYLPGRNYGDLRGTARRRTLNEKRAAYTSRKREPLRHLRGLAHRAGTVVGHSRQFSLALTNPKHQQVPVHPRLLAHIPCKNSLDSFNRFRCIVKI